MLYKDIAPMIILLTLIISALIAKKIKSSNISTIDGFFAIIGTILGLIITILNLIYSNNYLITIGPFITIASLLYMRYRNKLLTDEIGLNFNLSSQTLRMIQIIYWICISISLISYYQAKTYYRPPIFFFSISVAVGGLGLEILSRTSEKNIRSYVIISKILIISLILRLSAYFISPYPIGSDPWDHIELIKDISTYGTSYLPHIHEYYTYYPLMHLYASATGLLGNLTAKNAMSIIGVVLTFSTIFIYLSIKKITNNVQLALFSMLLINFSDFHIQWSIQVIAMSFGIAIYTMVIYLLLEQKEKTCNIYKLFVILAIFIIAWTHTVSSFILMISLISLCIGQFVYKHIYGSTYNAPQLAVNNTLCMLFAIILIYHWTNPGYPFFQTIIEGLTNSLLNEAKFLGRETISSVDVFWSSILDICGFLILVFFGIIGSLHSLSKRYQTKTKVSLIFMLVVLFFIFFGFPLMGMRDIMPYRWPAFIYTTFVLFSGIGIIQFANIGFNRYFKIIFVSMLLFTFSFFMITNSITNMDSPIFGENIDQKDVWTESEMKLFTNINNSYGNVIVSDLQTQDRPFQTYLKRENVEAYKVTSEGNMDWSFMNDKLIIWRKCSLTRQVQISGYRNPPMLLGIDFKTDLNSRFSNIYDTGEAKAYLYTHSVL